MTLSAIISALFQFISWWPYCFHVGPSIFRITF